MQLIDTHCHIQSIGLDVGERTTQEMWAKAVTRSPQAVIDEAVTAGVQQMICVGCDLGDSQLAVDFVQQHDPCYASIGIHPHEAQHYAQELAQRGVADSSAPSPYQEYGSVRASLAPNAASSPERSEFAGQKGLLDAFAGLASRPKVVAVGETGLESYYEHSPKEAQIAVLRFQIELALQHNLPLIFHVRDAFDDFWPIFESYRGVKGVLHSFTDNLENMQRAVSHGLYIGVNGIATFAKEESQRVMYRTIPQQLLLLETDAPFLTPTPFRGTINEPKYTSVVAEFLSELRGENLADLAAQTTSNAEQLFSF
jgi:TatD DNase family protein